ncbi:MAG: hypothetical protein OEY87_07800 [Gammaproteobacteria bacterium]|nr:hypothetical protein [Gammaproteobacteria bacterium]MDH5736011.1 hypothetical protein [Gammaproteobacteria bacterium]
MGGQLLKEADSFKNVTKDEIVIVGTIELTPKLQKDEQQLNPSGVIDLFGYGDMNKNRAMIQFNNQPKESDYKVVINPELDKPFFFKVSRDMKYLVEGSVLIEFSRYGNTGKIWLPTWFKVDIRPDDKAIYIGKIKYTRDDFNSITNIELIDDFKNANALFRKKFGKGIKLRKSLVKKI